MKIPSEAGTTQRENTEEAYQCKNMGIWQLNQEPVRQQEDKRDQI